MVVLIFQYSLVNIKTKNNFYLLFNNFNNTNESIKYSIYKYN